MSGRIISGEEAQALADVEHGGLCHEDAVRALRAVVSLTADRDAALRQCEELTRALRHVTAARAHAETECDALRAIVEGRAVAPTDAEIEAHDGLWLVQWGENSYCFAGGILTLQEMRAREWNPAIRWVPYRDGRPCAWPAVTEVSRGQI